MTGKHNLEQSLASPSSVLKAAAEIHANIETVKKEYQDNSDDDQRRHMRRRYVKIGRDVLRHAIVDDNDQSEAAVTLRIAQEMGNAGFILLWQAQRIARHIFAIKEQLAQQRGNSYIWLSESNGGLAIQAGNIEGEPSWAMEETSPTFVLSSKGHEQPLDADILTSVMTDTFSSPQLIYDWQDPEAPDGVEYYSFLQYYLGKDGEGVFPDGASMLAIGDKGIGNLLSAFYHTTMPHYVQTELGRLELIRFLARFDDVLSRKQNGEETINLPAVDSFHQVFVSTINRELSEMLPLRWQVPYEQIIRNWCINNAYPDMTALADRVATSMYIKCDPSSAGISYVDLLAAAKQEIQAAIFAQQQALIANKP